MAAAVANGVGTNGLATNGHTADDTKATNGTTSNGNVGKDIDTVVNYCGPPPEGIPYCEYSNVHILTGDRFSDIHPVHIKDVRLHDKDGKFNMETNGFLYLKHKSEHMDIDFCNDDDIKRTHYIEAAELVKKMTGAKHAFSFQHVYRHDVPREMSITRGKQAKSPPLGRAHIDLSPDGARTRLSIYYDENQEEVERAWKDGVLMISVWRPLNVVHRDPLSVMDTQTLPDKDILPFGNPLKLADRTTRIERLTITHNPEHQWYYMSEQTPEDVLFVKFVDSRAGMERQTGCPHTAVVIPGTEDAEARASLETRVMAFF